MLSQSIVNLIDAAIVGQLGSKVLAGVGIGGFASFMVASTVMGLSSAVQASVARRKGQNVEDQIAVSVNTGLLLAVLFSIPIMLIFWFGAETVIALMNQDPEVQTIATEYFQIRLLGLFSIASMLVLRGYWNGINRSGIFLRIQIITHSINVPLTYCLVYGSLGLPELGANGSAIATIVSLTLGMCLCLFITSLSAKDQGFMNKKPSISQLLVLIKLSLPHSFQQFLFSIGITVLLWIIGLVSTEALAIGYILIQLSLLLILPSVGLGLAATSLVSQALGSKNPTDAHLWGWDVVKTAVIIMFFLGLPLWLWPSWVLGLFVSDPVLIKQGILPLQITGISISLEVTALVLTQALLGAGANKQVMKISLGLQWFFFLPIAWFVGPMLGFGLVGIWMTQTVQRILLSCVFAHLWNKKNWITIKI